jgi:glycosyltransferase involved in cell wall biosynthesis
MKVLCFCKVFGNLNGGTKSSSYVFSLIGNNVSCVYHDESYSNIKYNRGIVQMIKIVLFNKDAVFFCFDHYAIIPILFNRKVLFWSHSNYISGQNCLSAKEKILRRIFQLIYRKAKWVLACSMFIQNEIRIGRTQCALLYPIFQTHNIFFNVIKTVKLKSDSRYLMVGNVDKRKYGFLLKESILNLSSITVIGRVISENVAASLRNKGAKLLGFQPFISYGDFDALLVASDLENVPAVIPEAISQGLPVITRQVGGVRELITEGKHGIVLDDKSLEGLLNGSDDSIFEFNNSGYGFCDTQNMSRHAVEVIQAVLKN